MYTELNPISIMRPKEGPRAPLEICAVGGLVSGALGRMFGGSPHFLFVFYRPDRRENVRSESRMVFSITNNTIKFYLFINAHVFFQKKKIQPIWAIYERYKHLCLHITAWLSQFCQQNVC